VQAETSYNGPPILQGLRVRLRPTTQEDAQILTTLRNSNPKAFFYSEMVDLESTRSWLETSNARGELNWVLELDGTVVGTISAIPRENGMEVGRAITASTVRRQGLMEEAFRLVLSFLAQHHPGLIYCEVKPDNRPIVNLLEKLGFVPTRLRMEWVASAL